MYCVNFSGGNNRTHGQIERADRIDSFEAGKVESQGILYASRGDHLLPLQCDRLEDRETVELSYPGSRWRCTLELARVPSGYGGDRAFWLCPRCGHRARYLYFKDLGFLCRRCAKLNYAVQQRTRSSTSYARDGMKLAREKLGWEPPFPVCPADFPYIIPDRPKGMHRSTYHRYLARYRRYQEKYRQESIREMLAILRR